MRRSLRSCICIAFRIVYKQRLVFKMLGLPRPTYVQRSSRRPIPRAQLRLATSSRLSTKRRGFEVLGGNVEVPFPIVVAYWAILADALYQAKKLRAQLIPEAVAMKAQMEELLKNERFLRGQMTEIQSEVMQQMHALHEKVSEMKRLILLYYPGGNLQDVLDAASSLEDLLLEQSKPDETKQPREGNGARNGNGNGNGPSSA
eukprot:TRINITY_DN7023_c0_g1_i2.p1 TRINITY_DN7023_c0_g1~~TRINITY_DN7023_c0_g1_i2.p1  ORF type:complete len:202 (+),score=17.77 TRINITY_DN7023_c0_g1_i2:167-772(+)